MVGGGVGQLGPAGWGSGGSPWSGFPTKDSGEREEVLGPPCFFLPSGRAGVLRFVEAWPAGRTCFWDLEINTVN